MTEQNGVKRSATEELRRMLDERGVKWAVPNESWNQDSITYWKVGSIKWVAFESENGTLWLNCNSVTDLTPEGAIEATLGRGEYKADKLCDGYLYYTSYWCKGCGERFAYRPISGKDRGTSPKFCPNCGSRIEVVGE